MRKRSDIARIPIEVRLPAAEGERPGWRNLSVAFDLPDRNLGWAAILDLGDRGRHLLIGASDKDNLWQWTGSRLTDHLDLMQSVGGNYVRNTMSDRNEGDLFTAKPLDDGRYDLDRWNDAYWERLRFFLEATHQRGIIVQLTLWDGFDLSGAGVYGRFAVHPLNPANNINWEPGTIKDAGDFYGGSLWHKNQPVLDNQHRYINQLLPTALQYDHVLYNINN